jgi:hypothetical protein
VLYPLGLLLPSLIHLTFTRSNYSRFSARLYQSPETYEKND